jgi:hypothetical protein
MSRIVISSPSAPAEMTAYPTLTAGLSQWTPREEAADPFVDGGSRSRMTESKNCVCEKRCEPNCRRGNQYGQ